MRKEEKTKRTRERILEAALQEFGKKGYEAASISGMCREYGIPKGLLYHNFSGKEELFLCLVEVCVGQITLCLEEEGEDISLKRYLEKRSRYFAGHPLIARVFFEAMLFPPEGLKNAIKERETPFQQMNLRIYRRNLSRLTLRKGVSIEDAIAYHNLFQEVFNGSFGGRRGEDMGAIMESHENGVAKLLDLMLYGIAEKEAEL